MKHIIVFFTVVIVFSGSVYGQRDFAPLGALWNYLYDSHDGSTWEQWSIKVTKDTLIDGYSTKTLTKYYVNPPKKIEGVELFGTLQLRNDSLIYYRQYPINGMHILSFSMKVNDTIHLLPKAHPNYSYAVVKAIDTVIINGKLKRWHMEKHCQKYTPVQKTIIENVGLIDDFLIWDRDGCGQIGGGSHRFGCYDGKTITYNQPCE